MSKTEQQLRTDLAACYRLVYLYGWTDLLSNHISVRVPGTDHFLINEFGLGFEEITASSLVKIDLDGNKMDHPESRINEAGFTIHSAVHQVRHDANCVLHLHTENGTAVSCHRDGLLPLTQSAMFLTGDIAYHDYEGPALDLEERKRIQADLGARHILILRNHGNLVVGETVAEAFVRMHMLEKACAYQIKALAMQSEMNHAKREAIQFTESLASGNMMLNYGDLSWPYLLRQLDRNGLNGYQN